jgi:hypothetical protein
MQTNIFIFLPLCLTVFLTQRHGDTKMQRIFLFLCAFVSLCEVLSLCEVSNIGFSHTKTRRHKDAENIFISLCLCVSV